MEAQNQVPVQQPDNNKIAVLNFGTFHMGFTPDENTTEFDEQNQENQRKVRKIAKNLAEFQPTVIVVEVPPDNEELQGEYGQYVDNPKRVFENPSEIELLAYEVGRLSGATKIYGIDHKMNYNYRVAREIDNAIDSTTVREYYENPFSTTPEIDVELDSLPLFDKLNMLNHEKFLDFLITINADILAYAGTEDGFEGADEAAKYYQRNLRMYSNLNRLPLTKEDRVFILMGASHTAFFRDFFSRSPKYEMVDTFKYLKK
ncbi:DUF5694 domain-containing protein [Tunicatimonas pelagia]|uniref:DUF5694 domain-containing protein n=1 Tax=Tunicatimonas pelagia TaxID=931531 RepID=UPI00266616B9|nr:DUF5694 domain-containing protein [Tunicatimonas pelagia]WKN45677.1 DUF5694 domain-containing protein [Tunicatimonas pelagia]